MATLTVSGQTRTGLPEAMLDTDEKVRAYLSTFMPDAGTAEITRRVDAQGDLHITVIKRAGPKGATAPASTRRRAPKAGLRTPSHPAHTRHDHQEPLPRVQLLFDPDTITAPPANQTVQRQIVAALMAAPEVVNPALALCWRLDEREAAGTLSLELLTRLGPMIERAEAASADEVQRITRTLAVLTAAPAAPRIGAAPDGL